MRSAKQYNAFDHTFVVLAYEESPYLDECISSVVSQSVRGGNVRIATSSPCRYIDEAAEKYGIAVSENPVKGGGLISDFAFAYDTAETPLVTIAHQDDIYCSDYLGEVLKAVNRKSRPLIAFTNYSEMRNGKTVSSNTLLRIKRLMNLPVLLFPSSSTVRRSVLRFGNPICCPSVLFCKDNIRGNPWSKNYRNDLDWETWIDLAPKKGDFVYCRKTLIQHRIHEDSGTSRFIADSTREREDREIIGRLWPEPTAKILAKAYSKAQNSNK